MIKKLKIDVGAPSKNAHSVLNTRCTLHLKTTETFSG